MSDSSHPQASDISVLSKDPKKKDEGDGQDKDKDKTNGVANGDVKGKGKDESSDEPEIVCLFLLPRDYGDLPGSERR